MSRAIRCGLAVAALVVVPIVVPGCGSGGGTTTPRIGAAFVPDRATPEPANVTLAAGAAVDDLVTVHATITDVDGLYGAAFDLTIDPAIATFVSYTPGEVLETGGHVPIYLVNGDQPGLVVFSASRLGPVPPVDVTGTHTLVSLTFRLNQIGSGSVAFQAAALYDDQLQPQPLPGIQWYGGTLVGD
jgi:hypothetical protein